MTDTSPEVRVRYLRELLRQSPARRLEMTCSMFGSAKALALAGIRLRGGRGSPQDEQSALFIRFYGGDFTREERASVVAHLRSA